MANKFLIKRSSVSSKNPATTDLALGELALNTYDGNLFFKKSPGGVDAIVTVATLAGTQTLTNKTLITPTIGTIYAPSSTALTLSSNGYNWALGTNGNITFPDGSIQPTAYTGPYTKVIANTTAIANCGYLANTGAGSFTITLPASPLTGQFVIIADDNNFATTPLYVGRNGNPIAGQPENLTIDIAGSSVTLMYDGGSWNVYTQIGASGGSGSGGTQYNFGSFPQGLIPDTTNTYTLGNSTYKWAYVNSYGYRYGDNTTQTTSSNADGSSITNSGGTITAQAGGLAGSTLNSGVTASSLQTLGTQTQRINWSGSGVAAPQFTSSSVGTKLLLYPAVSGSSADYAIGIESGTIWQSLPNASSGYLFKWYGGTTNIMQLSGDGILTLTTPTLSTTSTGTAAVFNTNATTLNMGGAATTVSIGSSSGTTTVNNNLVVTGTFTVNGTTETINATTVTVDDKNIELGSVATPTDITADGGGITLKGATDKTIIWDSANGNWTSNQDWNIATGKVFKINNTSVLSSTTLGSAVVTSSLTTVGTIGTGVWQGTLVAGQYGGTGVANTGKTITLGGNLTTSGAFTTTLTATANTSVTLPTTGTLATLAGAETLTNKTLTTPVISSITNTGTITIPTTTGTLALQGDTHYIGTTAVTLNRASANLALTGISSVTLPGSVSGTVQIIPTSAVGTGTVLTIPATTGTIITTGDSATVTNTMLAGSIANAKLTNSSVTIGSTAVSLGSTVTTFAGLASVTSTTFVGALTGNASTATTLATTRAIYGNNFDGSAALIGIIASTYGGTGNGFTKFTGPTTAEKTFTLPDASSTIVVQGGALGTPSSGTLTNCTFPTLNQNTSGTAAGLSATLVATSGGTGQSSYAVGDILYASTTTALSKLGAGTNGYVLTSGGAGVAPSWSAVSAGTAAAGTLTGSTLASGVTASSLTSVGTLTSLAVTTTTTSNAATITYNPTATSGYALSLVGKDTVGGTGYFDGIKLTNTTSGATNPNKSIRLNSTGNLEIINSAYTANIFSLSDTGDVTIPGTLKNAAGRPMATQTGGILQVVSTTDNTWVSVGNGTTYSQISTSITPLSTSSRILVMVTLGMVSADSAADVGITILRNTTALQQGLSASGSPGTVTYVPFVNKGSVDGNGFSGMLIDSPATTSSTTYHVRCMPNSGRSMVINKRNSDQAVSSSSTMILMEIAG